MNTLLNHMSVHFYPFSTLYEEEADLSAVFALANTWQQQGESVMVQPGIPVGMKFRQIYKFSCGEVKEIEINA